MPHVVGIGRTDSDDEVSINTRGTEVTLSMEIKDASGNQITDFGNLTLYTILISWDTQGNPQYVGEASAGTTTSASSWRIKRIRWDSVNNPVAVEWADGDTNFNNIWDNRASLNYS